MVVNRALTYVNSSTPLKIIENEINLDTCYNDKEIVVKIHAAAFNPVDFMLHDFANKWLVGSKTKTIGRDYAGVIVKVGKQVSKEWAVGDKVCGLFDAYFNEQGAMRDYLVFDPESSRTRLLCKIPEFQNPEHNDFVLGASWPLVFSTALQGFTEFGQKFGPESNVLVLGAGTSVGWYVAKIAKELFKVNSVVGTCSAASVERCSSCDICIDYKKEDVPLRLKEVISNQLQGQKFDLIYDCAGYNDLLPHIDDYLKPKSENSQYINIPGKVKYQFDGHNKGFLWKNITSMLRPHTSFNYHLLQIYTTRKTPPKFYEFLEIATKKDGYFNPPIDSVYSLDQYHYAEEKIKKALTYLNACTPLEVTKNEIDLDLRYKNEEIVVKVHSAAFNSSDFTLHDFGSKWLLEPAPKTIGRDFSGVIVRTGKNVSKEWSVGDTVCGLFNKDDEQGAMRDYSIFDTKSPEIQLLCKIPEFKNEDYDGFVLEASWPLVFSIALQGFTEFGQKFGPESNVLVLGAGTSVGWYVAKIAKDLFKLKFVSGACSKEFAERRFNRLGGYHAGGCDSCVFFDWEDHL
ncbi:unnamed protein product [Kluyveromyces dobzhanskii CBS 2104]|uniref:WGS project CCBQ000000000 data, contig 00107 n=1 Tax=Kluyveromyces dobzhanskii CBS 2104 TaxID=1427455 RepID=A0A0A8L0U6_9SACH|nr:unnamed protein product [Kluyveromyces dobzhanskii CBS 2104]